jgi:lipid-A-disaccharide synthase
MVSGSVSLEVLARGKPAVVCYRPTAMNYLYGKMLIHIKYMSLPNLMLNRELMPEVLYVFDVPKHAARMQSAIDRWLSNPQEMQAMKREMGALREQVMHTDGSAKAADAILKLLGEKQVSRAAA